MLLALLLLLLLLELLELQLLALLLRCPLLAARAGSEKTLALPP